MIPFDFKSYHINTCDFMSWAEAHNRQWYVWRIHWRIGKEHQSSGCQSIFVPCTVISSCRRSRSRNDIQDMWNSSDIHSSDLSHFWAEKKNRIWGNYGILGKFVQIGIWCILIISSSWVSNRVNKLTVCLSSASIGFRRKMQILWGGKPKDCESPDFSEEEKNILRAPRSFDGEKYIDVTLS